MPGIGVASTTPADVAGLAAAIAACAAADVCVAALGFDGSVCGEGHDRASTALNGLQGNLTDALLALGKPVVFTLFNGGVLGIDAVARAPVGSVALVEAFNPGVAGGAPVADALFGRANRWGKLPVSWPPLEYYALLPIEDMDMVFGGNGAGRTYKYYNASNVAAQTGASGANLYEIGFGLSYTTFSLLGDCPAAAASPWAAGAARRVWSVASAAAAAAAPPLSCSVTVTNTGTRDGDEVVTVFVVPAEAAVVRGRAARRTGAPRADPLASRLLVAFARVSVRAGGDAVVHFNISLPALAGVGEDGTHELYAGDYDVVFSRGHGDDVRVPVAVDLQGARTPLALRRDATW